MKNILGAFLLVTLLAFSSVLAQDSAAKAEREAAAAIDRLSREIEKDPINAMLYVERGLSYGRINHTSNELADYERAIDLGMRSVPIYHFRGVTLLKMKEYDRSLSDLNRAIELEPRGAELYLSRARLFEALGDVASQEADIERYILLLKNR